MTYLARALLIFLFISCFFQARAEIGFEDAVFPELATSGRALAVGNAFVARVNDQSAAFYNPAGLGSIRDTYLHVSNLHLETNRGWMRATAGGSAMDVPTNFPKGFSLDGTREILQDNKGEIAHSRFHAMPNFTTRYFTFGYLYSQHTRATIGKEEGANYEYAKRIDHGPYAALNISLFGGVIKFGATGIWLSRKQAVGEAPADQTLNLTNDDYKKGRSMQMISGAKVTLPIMWLPTFAAKMNNTLQSEFNGSEGYPAAPDKIKSSIDVGFSISPRLGDLTWLHLEVDYRDLSSEYPGVSSTRKINAGMEFDFARRFFLRFGYGDGFGSAGLGVKSEKLQVDLTTYAVDKTANEFRGKEDRRFSLTFSSGF